MSSYLLAIAKWDMKKTYLLFLACLNNYIHASFLNHAKSKLFWLIDMLGLPLKPVSKDILVSLTNGHVKLSSNIGYLKNSRHQNVFNHCSLHAIDTCLAPGAI